MLRLRKGWLRLAAVNIFLLLLLLQITGWLIEAKLFKQYRNLLVEDAVVRGLHYEEESVKRPHPYFGYIPSEPRSFETAEIFRAEKDPNRFRVGVFGGSTAEMFYAYNDRSQFFVRELQKLPQLQGRIIEVRNFAVGGYRQPQALNIAALFGEGLDLSINIEGHNELAYVFPDASFPPYYPLQAISHAHFSESAALQWFQKGVGYGKALRSLIDELNTEPGWWRAGRVLSYFRFFYHVRQVREWHIDEPQFKRPFSNHPQGEDDWERLRIWLKASCQQKNLLLAHGVDSIFFIQPIPWRGGLERQRRLPPYPPHVRVSAGYDALLQIPTARHGLSFVDTHAVFKDLQEDVFIDSCCHVNESGNEILTRLVVDQIRQLMLEPKRYRLSCQISDLLQHFNK